LDENSTNNNIDINIPSVDFKKIAPMLFLALVAVLLFNSFYTVNANENGVVLRLGKYYITTQPGLHFKIPFIDTVERVRSITSTRWSSAFVQAAPGLSQNM